MNVFLNGEPVAREMILGAKTTDRAGGRADSCEVVLREEYAIDQIDEQTQIEIEDEGYSTGLMRVTDFSSASMDQAFRINGTSLPTEAREKGWGCFENVTLYDLLSIGAREMGMDCQMYGIHGDIRLRRVVRRDETWPEFLAHVFLNESAVIKFEGGKLLAIGYEWAFQQEAKVQLFGEKHPLLQKRPKAHFMTVCVGLCQSRAKDTAVTGNASKTMNNSAQIYDDQQAHRAAKGLLMDNNLGAVRLYKNIELNTGMAAMTRVDIDGNGEDAGSWFVWKAEHDFIRRMTRLELRQPIFTIK